MNRQLKVKKQFRSFVLHLKKLHPSWKPKDIIKFLLHSENPPSYTITNALRLKVWIILKRNQVNDLSRLGTPRTTATIEYIQAVKEAIRLKRNAPIRNVNAKLQKGEYKTSNTLIARINKLLGLNGTFTLYPQYNQHNEGMYAESILDIPYELKTKSKEKFQKSIMLWGDISYQGLFPKQSPIFIDKWLDLIRPQSDDNR
ncbi:unnamed protein product [Didymodactylos carnosus]|uniref:Uncharacterized protein n=1 Tax=Didymodactylos carnosus TaxID=1234261 RepID=A0A813XP48_9BILA|nr:unnamed protein product [Didymodactylos carnosus]CAF3655467.1 unnamed protein product [Didymodactylos carnosus]